jgi:WD40 repeat protein
MLLVQILTEEPTSPRKLNSGVPRDLETITLKCLDKNPQRRYATARELADEMTRFLDGQPILARPVGRMERAWRWARRNPTLAGLSALILILASALTVGSVVAAVRLATARRDAEVRLAESLHQQARATWLVGQPGWRSAALEAIKNAAAIQPSAELRDMAVQTIAGRDVKQIAGRLWPSPIQKIAMRPDGKQIAVADRESIQLWNIDADPNAKRLKKFGDRYDHVIAFQFSRDGKNLLIGTKTGECSVYDVQLGRRVSRFQVGEKVASMQFGPGAEEVTVLSPGMIARFDWRAKHSVMQHAVDVGDAAAVADVHLKRGVFVVQNGAGPLWLPLNDTDPPRNLDVLGRGQNPLLCVSPSGRYLAFACNDWFPTEGGAIVPPPPPPALDRNAPPPPPAASDESVPPPPAFDGDVSPRPPQTNGASNEASRGIEQWLIERLMASLLSSNWSGTSPLTSRVMAESLAEVGKLAIVLAQAATSSGATGGQPPPTSAASTPPPPQQPLVPSPDQPVVPLPDQPAIPSPEQPTVPAPEQPILPSPADADLIINPIQIDPDEISKLLREATTVSSVPGGAAVGGEATAQGATDLGQLIPLIPHDQTLQDQPFVILGQAASLPIQFGPLPVLRLQVYDVEQNSVVATGHFQAGDLVELEFYQDDRILVATTAGVILNLALQDGQLAIEERWVPAAGTAESVLASINGRRFLKQDSQLIRVWTREGINTSLVNLCATSWYQCVSLPGPSIPKIFVTQYRGARQFTYDYANRHSHPINPTFNDATISENGQTIVGVDSNLALAVVDCSQSSSPATPVIRLPLDEIPQNAKWSTANIDAAGAFVVAGGLDGPSAILRKTHDGFAFERFVGPGKLAREICIARDGSVFAVAYVDRSLRLFDAASGKELAEALDLPDIAEGMSFSPDGALLACAHRTGGISLRHIPSLKASATLEANSLCWATAFSPDGKQLAIGQGEGSLATYDVDSRRRIFRWRAHRAPIIRLQFSQQGKELRSCDIQGGLVTWDVAEIESQLASIGLGEVEQPELVAGDESASLGSQAIARGNR